MEKERKTVVNITPAGNEVTILHGEALKPEAPNIITVAGVIGSPAEWLKFRVGEIDQKKCHVIVNREEMTIRLVIDEKEHFNTIVTGRLELDPIFERFGINSGNYMTNFQMAELFKMNRTHFENKDVAMKLVTEMQNFKAKVDKDIEKADNNRGDVRLLIAQTVKSNLPENFRLVIPVFKGTKPQSIEVEVYIRPDDLCCTLISPEANDIIESTRDSIIDDVCSRICNTAPELVIIEQ